MKKLLLFASLLSLSIGGVIMGSESDLDWAKKQLGTVSDDFQKARAKADTDQLFQGNVVLMRTFGATGVYLDLLKMFEIEIFKRLETIKTRLKALETAPSK